jgi:hypothetical protein
MTGLLAQPLSEPTELPVALPQFVTFADPIARAGVHPMLFSIHSGHAGVASTGELRCS